MRGVSKSIVAAVALAAAATASGCEAMAPGDGDPCLVDRIYHGVEASTDLGLGPQQLAALVAVYPVDRGTICSGVVVAHGVVVTAGHCVDPEAPTHLRVGYWDPERPEAQVESAAVHPELDVAVLFVDAAALPDALDPIPLLDGQVGEAWVGDFAELAGYGGTELGELGSLRFASEAITAVEADSIEVHGRGHSGACGGDSGGPLLARDDQGRVRVIGLLDSGHVSCVQDDHYTRVDALASWWPLDWRAPQDRDRGCEGLDAEGSCVRGHAMRCGDEGRVQVQWCDQGEVCGQRPDEPGFACVAPEDDACDGAGSRAWCDGELLVRCEGGDQRVHDCGACGQSCGEWTAGGGAGCVGGGAES